MPVGSEAVNPGVAVAVADVNLPVGGDGGVGRPVEGRPAALDAAVGLSVVARVRGLAGGADHHDLLSFGGELAHGVIAVVDDVHHVILVDGDSVGALGEDPLAPGADKISVPVVHDELGILPGHQVYVVLGIDRHPVHVLVDISRR